MDYTEVSKDQQRQILKGRIAGWEADHYGHTINLAALQAAGSSDAELESTKQALSTLEASINAGKAMLNDVPAPVADPTPEVTANDAPATA